LRFEEGDYLARLLNIPDVHPKANNLNGKGVGWAALGQQSIHNVFWRALDSEFLQHGVLVQIFPAIALHVGQKIAKA
jgi:hypothetical protein